MACDTNGCVCAVRQMVFGFSTNTHCRLCLFFSLHFPFFLPDVDECAADRNLCQPYGSCENRPGSYMCVCNHGYVLSEDKHSCERKLAPIPSAVLEIGSRPGALSCTQNTFIPAFISDPEPFQLLYQLFCIRLCHLVWNLNLCLLTIVRVSEIPSNEVSLSPASGLLWHHKVPKPLSGTLLLMIVITWLLFINNAFL